MTATARPNDPITRLVDALMRAVVATGVIRRGRDDDVTLAVEVLRAHARDFLVGDNYAAERDLVTTGQSQLALMSVVASIVAEIAERRAP